MEKNVLNATKYSELPLRKIIYNPFKNKHIISYGIMLLYIDKSNKRHWLTIQRKHSAEFLLLIRGIYRRGNVADLIYGNTPEERERILMFKVNNNLKEIYDSIFEIYDDKDRIYAEQMMRENWDIIEPLLVGKEKENLYRSENEWLWPKGRKENWESYLECAKRELYEETGIKISDEEILDLPTITNIMSVSGGKIYETKYFLAIADEMYIPDIDRTEKSEVAQCFWIEENKLLNMITEDKIQTLYLAVKDLIENNYVIENIS